VLNIFQFIAGLFHIQPFGFLKHRIFWERQNKKDRTNMKRHWFF